MRPVQRFSVEYLRRARESSAEEIVRFLDDFRRIHAAPSTRSRPISLRVPEPLLAAFKARCRLEGVRYQTRIKQLMEESLGT